MCKQANQEALPQTTDQDVDCLDGSDAQRPGNAMIFTCILLIQVTLRKKLFH